MALEKITKKILDNLKPPEKPTVLWDSSRAMKGFGCRISAQASKPTVPRIVFVVRYWAKSARTERWMTIGRRTEAFTLTVAKEKALAILLRVELGFDPVEDARQEKAERAAAQRQTVAPLVAEWLEGLPRRVSGRGRLISARTVASYSDSMRLNVLPKLGAHPVLDVTRKDVRSIHRTITRKGGPFAANRSVSALSIFYCWLQENELVPQGFNPASKPPRNPEPSRGANAAVRMTEDQESRLTAAIYALMGEGIPRTNKAGKKIMHSDPIGAAALLVLLDSGRRKSEILRLQWHRLDFEAQTASLGKTKGKLQGDVCYLTSRACDAIRALPRIVGNPHVFSGHGKSGRRASLQSTWRIVKQAAGLETLSPDLDGFRIHDLRHNATTRMLAAGIAPQLIIQQTGHTSFDQLKTYSHIGVQDVALALSKLEPVEPAQDAEVISITRGK